MNPKTDVGLTTSRARVRALGAGLALLMAAGIPSVASAQDVTDPVTGFARTPVHVAA
jgi:hypothetical protein